MVEKRQASGKYTMIEFDDMTVDVANSLPGLLDLLDENEMTAEFREEYVHAFKEMSELESGVYDFYVETDYARIDHVMIIN